MVEATLTLEQPFAEVQHVFEKFFTGVDFSDATDTSMKDCVAAFDLVDGMAVFDAKPDYWIFEDKLSPLALLHLLKKEVTEIFTDHGGKFPIGFDPRSYAMDFIASAQESLMFFRYIGESAFEKKEDVLAHVSTFSFWLPSFFIFDGAWVNTCDIDHF